MSQPLTVFQPQFFAKFRCIGAECEDTCCDGMGVVLDKDTYAKYRSCQEPTLKPLIDLHVHPNRTQPSAINHGMIAPSHRSACPFLTDARICAIQARLGESFLSRTCSVYPRAMTTIDGIVERSLYLSCPEAARLVLLDPAPIRFELAAGEPDPRLHGFPMLDTAGPDTSGKPYHAFQDVRGFLLALLQNRTYRLWERLIILGMFCDQLNQIGTDESRERIPELLASFSDYLDSGGFGAALDNVAVYPAVQLNFLLNAIEYRVHAEPVGQRFLDCYNEFLNGIGFAPDAGLAALSDRYTESCAHYDAFMDRHEHILEHYVVNYVFRTQFPFGPQQSAYLGTRSPYDDFVLLIVHYALIRSLLVGMAGCHRSDFSPAHCVKLIQSFAKAVEHNRGFLKRVVQSLEENAMTDLAVMAVFVKPPARADTIRTPKVPDGARVVLKAPVRAKKTAAAPVPAQERPDRPRRRRTRVVPSS